MKVGYTKSFFPMAFSLIAFWGIMIIPNLQNDGIGSLPTALLSKYRKMNVPRCSTQQPSAPFTLWCNFAFQVGSVSQAA